MAEKRVVLSPHSAALTEEALIGMGVSNGRARMLLPYLGPCRADNVGRAMATQEPVGLSVYSFQNNRLVNGGLSGSLDLWQQDL